MTKMRPKCEHLFVTKITKKALDKKLTGYAQDINRLSPGNPQDIHTPTLNRVHCPCSEVDPTPHKLTHYAIALFEKPNPPNRLNSLIPQWHGDGRADLGILYNWYMSAKDNMGNQFIEVFRGFAGVSPDQLDTGRLGRHWSTYRSVAESFANDSVGPDEPSTVVSGLVRAKHVIPHDTEEWDDEAGQYGADRGDVEGERTLRPGARVHVTGITHYPNATEEKHTFREDMSFKDLRKYRA